MDMMNEKFKNEKNEIIVKSYFRLLLEVVSIFEVHNNMSAKSAIEKLQKITKEKEAQRIEQRHK
jgi:hypothetical protein